MNLLSKNYYCHLEERILLIRLFTRPLKVTKIDEVSYFRTKEEFRGEKLSYFYELALFINLRNKSSHRHKKAFSAIKLTNEKNEKEK